jgi:hypothetical protein
MVAVPWRRENDRQDFLRLDKKISKKRNNTERTKSGLFLFLKRKGET